MDANSNRVAFQEVTIFTISHDSEAGFAFGFIVISASLLLFAFGSLSIWRTKNILSARAVIWAYGQFSLIGLLGGVYMVYANALAVNPQSDMLANIYLATAGPTIIYSIVEGLCYLIFRNRKRHQGVERPSNTSKDS